MARGLHNESDRDPRGQTSRVCRQPLPECTLGGLPPVRVEHPPQRELVVPDVCEQRLHARRHFSDIFLRDAEEVLLRINLGGEVDAEMLETPHTSVQVLAARCRPISDARHQILKAVHAPAEFRMCG